jgi:hypothetical protein
MTEKPLPPAAEPEIAQAEISGAETSGPGATEPSAIEATSIIVEPSGGVSQATDGDTTSASAQRTYPKEIGGRDGPEPTRFGDWEKAGRCIDF